MSDNKDFVRTERELLYNQATELMSDKVVSALVASNLSSPKVSLLLLNYFILSDIVPRAISKSVNDLVHAIMLLKWEYVLDEMENK